MEVLLAASLFAAAAPATAQTQFDANCQPATFTEDQQFEQEICKSHAGCAMIFAGGQKFCKGFDFLRHIGDRLTGSKPLTNDDLIDATEPDYPRSTFTSRIMSKVKSVTDAVFDSKPEPRIYSVGAGTDVAYSETLPSGNGRRAGAVIYSTGVKARGQFSDPNMILSGTGERIAADGAIKAGDFRNGVLAGEGFKTEKDGRSTDVYEGTFDNDVPVGEVVHRFADGTSARELWQNGKMVERGRLASKGGIPPRLESQTAATSPRSGSTPASSGLSGVWRGDSSGNMVRLTKRPGGYDVAAAGGNSSQPLFYSERSDGSIVFTFPDGKQSIGQPLSDGSLRLTQPGFSDVFRRGSNPQTLPKPALAGGDAVQMAVAQCKGEIAGAARYNYDGASSARYFNSSTTEQLTADLQHREALDARGGWSDYANATGRANICIIRALLRQR